MVRHFKNYLNPTKAKLVLWLLFLILYILGWLIAGGYLPKGIQTWFFAFVYSSSAFFAGTSSHSSSVIVMDPRDNVSNSIDLFIVYALTTYLFSCIFVESFDIMRRSKHRRK